MPREDKDTHPLGGGDHGATKEPIHGVLDRPIHGSPGRPMNGVFLRPMVGRRKKLLWVGRPTYRRSSRRPIVGFISGLSRGGFLPPCSVEGGGMGEGASAFWYNFVKEKLIERAKLPHKSLRPIATT